MWFAICPMCGKKIKLIKRKDFESHSKIEYAEHVKSIHPEKQTSFGVPFAKVVFE